MWGGVVAGLRGGRDPTIFPAGVGFLLVGAGVPGCLWWSRCRTRRCSGRRGPNRLLTFDARSGPAAAELGVRRAEERLPAVAANPFPTWLSEVAADAVVVRPGEPLAESRDNQWGFGLDDQQRAAVSSDDVEEFVRAVAAGRGRWLAGRDLGPMQFYCWHDAQAGQLRFSLVSGGGIRSLFGRPVEPVSLLRAVVRDFLSGGEPEEPLLVWVKAVP